MTAATRTALIPRTARRMAIRKLNPRWRPKTPMPCPAARNRVGAGGNGGVHVNAANAANLIFIGSDEQTNGTVGIWDRNGQGSVIRK